MSRLRPFTDTIITIIPNIRTIPTTTQITTMPRMTMTRRMCRTRIAGMIAMITATIITTTLITSTATTLAKPMPTPSAEPSASGDLPLMLWLSPAFPVGSYAYSHGLEWAVEAGDIADAATLSEWLDDLLNDGAPRSDAVLFACAWRAVRGGDFSALTEINDLAIALCGSNERRLETSAQGGAFLTAIRAAWPCGAVDPWAENAKQPVAYPIAVAFAAAGHGLSLEASLPAFLIGGFANLVSAAIRLGAIGQTDGQRVLARLTPLARASALSLVDATFDDLGSCAIRSDIAAMKHETQYSRLFRS
jgi:urease accessory protein